MYANLNNLCHYNLHRPKTIMSNRHFLKPNNSIYKENKNYIIPARKNFSPGEWGPGSWIFLESAAKAYPENPTYSQKIKMRRFLESLTECLPCGKCRNNFCKEVTTLEDKDLQSPRTVLRWLMILKRKIADKKLKHQSGTFTSLTFMTHGEDFQFTLEHCIWLY